MTISQYPWRTGLVLFLTCVVLTACRSSSLLNVQSPVGIIPSTALNSPSEAADAFAAAQANFFNALASSGSTPLIEVSELLSDEFVATTGTQVGGGVFADERFTNATGGTNNVGLPSVTNVLAARSDLLLTVPPLATYELGASRAEIGEAYALAGYAELFLAEDFCAGVPLSQAVPGGGVIYGKPLTTDSLLAVAEAHFDSALAEANESATVTALASVGLGRALLDRDSVTAAAAAVSAVPTVFVYNIVNSADGSGTNNLLQPNFFSHWLYGANQYFDCVYGDNMSDREGGNGLNYVSAADPRLVVDSTLWETCDGHVRNFPDSVWYYPLKFGNPSINIPLASGLEARLIEAEAALTQPNDSWLTDLNTLRYTQCTGATNATCTVGTAQVPAQSSGLLPLADPGSDTARVSLLFRERAFWLYGTGSRVSDMRRLMRQYNRPAQSVFPTGPYQPAYWATVFSGVGLLSSTYGTDVSLQLPDQSETNNPYYTGCLTSTATP